MKQLGTMNQIKATAKNIPNTDNMDMDLPQQTRSSACSAASKAASSELVQKAAIKAAFTLEKGHSYLSGSIKLLKKKLPKNKPKKPEMILHIKIWSTVNLVLKYRFNDNIPPDNPNVPAN